MNKLSILKEIEIIIDPYLYLLIIYTHIYIKFMIYMDH